MRQVATLTGSLAAWAQLQQGDVHYAFLDRQPNRRRRRRLLAEPRARRATIPGCVARDNDAALRDSAAMIGMEFVTSCRSAPTAFCSGEQDRV